MGLVAIAVGFAALGAHLGRDLSGTTGLVPWSHRGVLDGRPPGDDHGLDVNELGDGTVDEPRMFQLGGAAEPTFEIMFHDPGVRAYVFTFG